MQNPDGLQIGVAALRDMIASGAPVAMLDVREPWEHDICRIERSVLIPLSELPARSAELGADEAPLVVICHHGARSFHATLWLRQQGFDNAVNLAGGIDAWASEIDPSMRRY
ncbi:rhodanese-like domain-containing protein [Dongia sp.]|uniref:rhodanese-like domain-containing protein n=1 Tax=Dongia sp. TaxID=1977262 RepID=UPI0035AE27BF